MNTSKPPKRPLIEHWQIVAVLLALFDYAAMCLSYFLALWIRYDCRFSNIPLMYRNAWRMFVPAWAMVGLVIFILFKLYNSIWRFASFTELVRVFAACVVTAGLHAWGITVLIYRMPMSYYLAGALIQFILVAGIRFSYRLILLLHGKGLRRADKHVMLIGAGSAGQIILRDLQRMDDMREKVVCVVDDNTNKWGRSIDGVPIVGGRDAILESVERYQVEKIYLAIPSATLEQRRDILNICKETDCELKVMPGISQLAKGEVSVTDMKDVSVEDLLGRDQIRPEMKEVYEFLSGKTVLVTGGGGSIGSELCRQIAAHHPKQLIIFDVYENNAYDIQNELKDSFPDLNLVTLIGSVRDSRRMFQVFRDYRPQIVYHAAAHKHVPLMEDSPCEAVKNNALGTYKTAYAAMVYGCERFVLISTDKAVNPTNIMGASKRLCEMIIQTFDAKIKAGKADELPRLFTHPGDETDGGGDPADAPRDGKTEFVAVRFGNVLGSNGSVIPLFRKQIAKGGPVTVTHPDIIRYFMTIPEAVRLVMLAGTYAHGGEIFVLDMGSPVKIDTLARNMIRLSGLKPDVDIRIEYTGLRPGEKLYEEKLMAEEGLKKTENELIHIGCPIPFDEDEFLTKLADLMQAAYHNRKDIRESVAAMVNTYHPEAAPTIVKDGAYTALTDEVKNP